jgi:excisionase family DNA binding protein
MGWVTISAPESQSLPTLTISLDAESVESIAAAVAERCAVLIPEPESDRWVTSREAAGYLAVPYSTLKAWTARGELPAYQDTPGGNYYFKRTELDDWRRSNVPSR